MATCIECGYEFDSIEDKMRYESYCDNEVEYNSDVNVLLC